MEPENSTDEVTREMERQPGQILPAQAEDPCPTCGDDEAFAPIPVYAIGRVELRFPSLGVEKEFAQAGARAGAGGTDAEVLQATLQANRYLARQVCWVLSISGMDTYLLRPRDPADYALLIEAVRDAPAPADMDVVIGWLGPGTSTCGVLTLPVVMFDQIYSFGRQALLDAIPRPGADEGKKLSAKDEDAFNRTANEVLDRLTLMTDNAGATDEDRALNFLSVRYDALYARTADAHNTNQRLSEIRVEPAPVGGARKMLDVIFTYADRATDVPDRYFVRVDVEEEFPFLVSRLTPYYSR